MNRPQSKKKSVTEFLQGRDVLVVLHTGEGKSLCFATLPLRFDFIRRFIAARDNVPWEGESILCHF